MPGSSYSMKGGKPSSSSGWALHELAENHQFASGVIVSLLALAMAFGIIGLIAAVPHDNLDSIIDGGSNETKQSRQIEAGKLADVLDTPQAFVIRASRDMDDTMTGGNPQWVGHGARVGALLPDEKGGSDHGSPHRG